MSEKEKLQLENECLLKYSKAQMIQKYIDELEENISLSDLWCKSQEENKELKQKVKYYENFEINKTVDKIRLENNKREKELQLQLQQKENIINKAVEYHDNCINNLLDLDKIDENERLAYKVAYEIHDNYLNILKGENNE